MTSFGPGRLILLGALGTFASLSIDISLPALPAIASTLHASRGVVQSTISSFVMTFGIGQLLVGPLADRYGRRPVLIAGVTLYTLAAALCAVSIDASQLVVLRFMQGFAACTGVVCARAIVRDISHDLVRGATRQAYQSALSGLAPVTAPLTGAAILALVGWRWIFGALALFGGTLVILVSAFIPETRPPGRAVDAHVGLAFRRVLGVPRMIPLMVVVAGGFFAYFAQIAGSSFALEAQLNVPVALYAVAFALNALMLIASFFTSARLVRLVGPERVLAAGIAIVGAGGLAALLLDVFVPVPVAFIATMMCFAYGYGLVSPNVFATVLNHAPHDAGTAAGLLGATMFVSGSLGSAIASTLPLRPTAAIGIVAAFGAAASVSAYLASRRSGKDIPG
jgi:MFS transporter, DHA1 family, multidrug resistance protein